MDGPRSRPSAHDKPLPGANASSTGWDRPQFWGLSAVGFPPLMHSETMLILYSIDLSLMHPRLLFSVILLDPLLQLSPNENFVGTNPPGMVNAVAYRRDLWPSREAAARSFAKSPMFASWDQRVLERMVTYGLRDLPTALYPDTSSENGNADSSVTLTSTKHQEVWTMIRPNYSSRDASGRIQIDRSTHADLDPLAAFVPLYRPEPRSTFLRLAAVRPSVLWLMGGASNVRLDEIREGIKVTGTGVGGSGGVADGRVKEVTFAKRGHFFPFEIVGETAQECALWLGAEMARFRGEEEEWRKARLSRPAVDDLMMDEAFKNVVKPPTMARTRAPRPTKL